MILSLTVGGENRVNGDGSSRLHDDSVPTP